MTDTVGNKAALIEVKATPGRPITQLKLALNGTDVTRT